MPLGLSPPPCLCGAVVLKCVLYHTHAQVNAERGWLLLAMCLAVCAPSDRLYPYLLCYVSQHGASPLLLCSSIFVFSLPL